MAYEFFHEVEAVDLQSVSERRTSELVRVLEKHGFTLHEDVFSFDRKCSTPPWQHDSVIELEVLHNDQEVYDFEEGLWSTLRLKYLFASLPFEFVDQFIEVAYALSQELGTSLMFRGRNIDRGELKAHFERYRDEVLSMTGDDVGSEGLAILIHATYPRR